MTDEAKTNDSNKPTKTFRDKNDLLWTVELDIPTMRRIKDAVGIDLTAPLSGGGKKTFQRQWDQISNDTFKLVDMLYVACESQCNDRGLTDEDFGRSLDQDSLDLGLQAFMVAYTDFFPPKHRRAMLKAMELTKERVAELPETEITDQMVTNMVDKAFDRLKAQTAKVKAELMSGNSSTICSESSEPETGPV